MFVLFPELTTLKLFIIAVHEHVHIQVALFAEPPMALMAFEGLFLGVGPKVTVVPGFVPEMFECLSSTRLNAFVWNSLFKLLKYFYMNV